MNIKLNEEQLKLKDEFRKFVDENIIPTAEENDRLEVMPEELIKKIANNGYLGSMIPKEYGGQAFNNVLIAILNEEMGRGCSSVRGLLTVHGMCALGILRWANSNIKQKYLPRMSTGELIGAFALTECKVGSDAKSITTSAVLDGEYYIINGKKKWITIAQVANVFLVFAKCGDKPTAFVVDRFTEGLTVTPMKNLMGARASMVGEIEFTNCKVPKENIVGGIGTGLSHVASSCLDYGRYTIACGCVGIAQGCLEESIKYSRERKQFKGYLRENQLIKKMIAEMVVDIKAARLLCYNAGYLKDNCDPESIMETWNAKYFASTMLGKITSDAVQIHGGNGISSEFSVSRYFRDAKINEIIEGTNQIHEILIANNAYNVY